MVEYLKLFLSYLVTILAFAEHGILLAFVRTRLFVVCVVYSLEILDHLSFLDWSKSLLLCVTLFFGII